MKFELVWTKQSARFYKSSEPIKYYKGIFGEIKPSGELRQELLKTGKEQYDHLIKNYNFDLIVISDASTHTERLAFFAASIPEENKYGIFSYARIAGKNTMMIHGGDQSTIKPDNVYLRYIAMINNRGLTQCK